MHPSIHPPILVHSLTHSLAHRQWCWTVVSGTGPLCLHSCPGSSVWRRTLAAPSAPSVPSPRLQSLLLSGCHPPFLLLLHRLLLLLLLDLETLWGRTLLRCLPCPPWWLLLTCHCGGVLLGLVSLRPCPRLVLGESTRYRLCVAMEGSWFPPSPRPRRSLSLLLSLLHHRRRERGMRWIRDREQRHLPPAASERIQLYFFVS